MEITAHALRSPSAIPPPTSVSPASSLKKWSAQYKADHHALQGKLENIQGLHRLDSVELLKLQALTQRFSIQTELSARLADRLQQTTRQLLQQGG